MNDLKWSLMEEGQVEPIGVHQSGTGYTIVWGHRRTEAARRAGWTEIEGVIVPQDEVDNLIQAGIENLASEDMSADDKARWVHDLVRLGLRQETISRRSGINAGTINKWYHFKLDKDAGVEIFPGKDTSPDDGIAKITEIRSVLGNDLESKKAVAAKVSEDRLTRDQTREVAEAYRDAPTPEIKKKVLEVPIMSRDTAADILRRSQHRVEMETGIKSSIDTNDWQKEREERREMEQYDFAVKEFLDMTRAYMEVAQKGHALVKYGKYSAEAARFAIRKIDALIGVLKTYREELEEVK